MSELRRAWAQARVLLALLLGATPAGAIPAFPGAEGFGAQAVGGRGGRVIEVTNLDDAGPGSLRAAVEASGPRIVVFRVGGTIDVRDKLKIRDPFITIAGQTAPGGGIALRGHKFYVEADHVIIRFLRFRLGPVEARDAVAVTGGAQHVILDHCSFSWGDDETMSMDTGASDVTLQWSIVSEGLNHADHGYGSLLSSETRRISLHHNLWAHFVERLPKLDGTVPGAEYQLVNNVMYDWDNSATNVSAHARANVIGNSYRPGPCTDGYPGHREIRTSAESSDLGLYVEGNVGPTCPDGCADAWDMVESSESYRAAMPFPMPRVTTSTAQQAFGDVLAGAGATLPVRDAGDQRIVREVADGTGCIIELPSDVGGWPALAEGAAPSDGDHDGVPDAWELAHGLDPHDGADGASDPDANGYTEVEEYLNELAGAPPPLAPPAAPILLP